MCIRDSGRVNPVLSMGGADENGIILLPVPQIVKVNPYGAGRDKGIIKQHGDAHAQGKEQKCPEHCPERTGAGCGILRTVHK